MDIEYPGFGTIVIEGERYDHDVVIEGGSVRKRKKGPSRSLKVRFGHTPLSVGETIPWSKPRLIIGTGYSGRLTVMDEVRVAAAKHGVELVEAPTADACGILQGLDRSDVNAILHLTC